MRACTSKLCAKAYRKLPPVVESQSDGSASMRHDGKGNAVLKMLHVASAHREIYGRYYRETENPYRRRGRVLKRRFSRMSIKIKRQRIEM